MWRLLAAFGMVSGFLCACASAGVIARYAREGSGGVPGVRQSIRLPLELCSDANCAAQPLELFGLLSLGPANVGRTVRADPTMEADFTAILSQLTDGGDDVLRFRPSLMRLTGGVVQADSTAITESEAFFPTHPTFVDFSEFVVEEVRLTLDALALQSPGADPNGDGDWTDYTYRATYTVMGYPIPKADCNHDDHSTLADWRYLRTTGPAPNRCMRGPAQPVPIGCDCGNIDANPINEFDMDLRDFGLFQNAFYPP